VNKATVTISPEHAAALDEVERITGIMRFRLVALILCEALERGPEALAAKFTEAGIGLAALGLGPMPSAEREVAR
jgi:hypothetical protein